MIVPPDTLLTIKALISQNRKIQAVALLKQVTKCSLKEAKDYVDQLEEPKVSFTGNIDNQLRALLVQGNKLEAIKIYRDQSGRSLAESKEYVESLDQYGSSNTQIDKLLQDQTKPRPSYTWLIVLLIAAAIIAWALLRQ